MSYFSLKESLTTAAIAASAAIFDFCFNQLVGWLGGVVVTVSD